MRITKAQLQAKIAALEQERADLIAAFNAGQPRWVAKLSKKHLRRVSKVAREVLTTCSSNRVCVPTVVVQKALSIDELATLGLSPEFISCHFTTKGSRLVYQEGPL